MKNNIKLIFDITQLTARPVTGVGKLIEGLIEEFKTRKDLELIYFALTARGLLPELRLKYPNLKAPTIPARLSKPAQNLAQTMNIPIDLFSGPADAAITTGTLCLPVKSGINIAAFYDAFAIMHPEWTTKANIKLFSRYLKGVEKNADLVIASSDYSLKLALKHTNIPKSKLKVIYPGVYQAFTKKLDAQKLSSVKKTYKLPEKYLLFVGSQVKRKNLKGLIKAFSALSKKTKNDTKLVLVGSKERGKKRRRPWFVHETGFIPDKDLPAVYGLSSGLVYPSFEEGFGFPIVEAFSMGIPVLTSNTSSMKEIAEGAAILVNPYSVEDITRGLEDLLTLSDKRRSKLVKEGKKRIKRFNFKNMADIIIKEIKKRKK